MKKAFNKVLAILMAANLLAATVPAGTLSAFAAKKEEDRRANQQIGVSQVEGKRRERIKEKRGFRHLDLADRQKIEEAVGAATENGAEAAEIVNEFTGNEEDFRIAVREVLDSYYSAETIDAQELEAFCADVDDSATEIIENYGEAAEERANADELDYETEKVLVSFAYGTPMEDIEMAVANEAVSYELIHDGNFQIADDLPDYKKERLEAIRDYKTSIVVLIEICLEDTVERAATKFETINCVVAAENNTYFEADGETMEAEPSGDPNFDADQWNLRRVNIQQAWNEVDKISTVDPMWIAVIDSGVSMKHDDLKDNLLQNRSVDVTIPYDPSQHDINEFNGKGGKYKKLATCSDKIGGQYAGKLYSHGTRCAGIIAAEANNGIMGAGAASMRGTKAQNAHKIMAIKASKNQKPSTGKWTIISKAYMAAAIIYAVENGADVISMSNGRERKKYYDTGANEDHFQSVYEAIEAAGVAGIPVIVAAGNAGNYNVKRYPAAFTVDTVVKKNIKKAETKKYPKLDNVISVGATYVENGKDTPAPFSNYGRYVDIVAPGGKGKGFGTQNVYSTYVAEKKDSQGNMKDDQGNVIMMHNWGPGYGTSYATPLVAATVAMMRSVNYDLTPKQIKAVLTHTSSK